MTRITYTLRLTADRTIEIRVGRYREYVGLLHKDKAQIFDAVKYALISKEAFFGDVRLIEDLDDLMRRHL